MRPTARCGGYSGGMKRRLDLALALVHRPSILFLDEPTTGLDPQSRTALWEEVARLAREDNVTVFLTTQYLEEADVLADRVGIIDHGKIVAEGTPAALKAEIGRPSIHVIPRQEEDRPRIAELLGRFGEKLGGERDLAVRLGDGLGMADVIRAMDASGIVAADVELRAPTLDDVFLAKTGRTLEGAATGEDGARIRMSALPTQVGALAQRSIMRTARQPASAIPPLLFPVALMLAQLGRPPRLDRAAGIPDRLVPRLRARRAVHPGRAVLDDERRHRPRPRHPDRVLLPALADSRARRERSSPASSRGSSCSACSRRSSTSRAGCCSASTSPPGAAGIALLLVYAALVAVGFGAIGSLLALRTGSGEAIQGLFPLLFVFLFISSMNTPRNLIAVGWFQFLASINPISYLIECVRSLIITGWDARGPRARVRHRDRARDRRGRRREPRDGTEARARMNIWPVASGVAWRTLKNVITTPSLVSRR